MLVIVGNALTPTCEIQTHIPKTNITGYYCFELKN